MKKVLLGILIVGAAVYGYEHFRGPSLAAAGHEQFGEERGREESADTGGGGAKFSCDGRTRCSQMTSCDEAVYFLENCPGVKMDGEGDGIPCEGQWCGHRR